jgi:hypothetical protein
MYPKLTSALRHYRLWAEIGGSASRNWLLPLFTPLSVCFPRQSIPEYRYLRPGGAQLHKTTRDLCSAKMASTSPGLHNKRPTGFAVLGPRALWLQDET